MLEIPEEFQGIAVEFYDLILENNHPTALLGCQGDYDIAVQMNELTGTMSGWHWFKCCLLYTSSQEKPVRYELGMTGSEELDAAIGDDDYFGFGVDAGMGCVADIQTQSAFKAYWAKRLEEDPDIDPYNDLFCDLLEENAKAHPKYQLSHGDWLNWTVPDTDCNLPIFSSGWGDGYYPVYFGYDAKGEVCAVYVRFIDIEASYGEQE